MLGIPKGDACVAKRSKKGRTYETWVICFFIEKKIAENGFNSNFFCNFAECLVRDTGHDETSKRYARLTDVKVRY